MSLVLSSEQLRYVTQSRLRRYRPAKFRSILPIDSSVPTWADSVEHSEIVDSGEDPVVIGNGDPRNLPRPTLSRSSGYVKILSVAYLYGWTDDEIDKASRLGIQLSSALATANQGRFERWMDSVAAGEKYSSLGLPGLLNISGKGYNTASTKTGGGTTWANATFDEIIADVGQSIEAVVTATKENYEASQVILPTAQYQQLERMLHPTSTESAMTLLRRMYPGVVFRAWYRCSTADHAGTGPRMVTMATGEEIARVIAPRPALVDKTPVRTHLGWEIAQVGSTAGVLVETPDAIVYTDGI